MGYRANVVKNYAIEYGDCIGFNYDFQGLVSFLQDLELEIYADENQTYIEILSIGKLLKINAEIKDECKRNALKSLVETAKNARYVKEKGFLRIEFF